VLCFSAYARVAFIDMIYQYVEQRIIDDRVDDVFSLSCSSHLASSGGEMSRLNVYKSSTMRLIIY